MQRFHKALVLALVFSGTALTGGVSRAQPQGVNAYPECVREPTEGDVQAAKGAFQAGQAAFKEADYPRAIIYWEDAYRRDCTAHPLLLNLATAYELSGNKERAAHALDTYLVRRPDAADADQISRRIEVLRRQLEEARKAAQPAPVAPAPEVTRDKQGEGEPLRDDSSDKGRPVLPLIITGAGGAIAVVGVVIWAGATSDINDLEKQCPGRMNCPPQVAREGNAARSRQNLGGVTAAAGLSIATAGVVWYFLSPEESAERAASRRLTPLIGPGFAGFSLSGRF